MSKAKTTFTFGSCLSLNKWRDIWWFLCVSCSAKWPLINQAKLLQFWQICCFVTLCVLSYDVCRIYNFQFVTASKWTLFTDQPLKSFYCEAVTASCSDFWLWCLSLCKGHFWCFFVRREEWLSADVHVTKKSMWL